MAGTTGILVREFTVLYKAFCEGRPSPLVELEIQYADYAIWQREWLRGELLERGLDYWRTQLAGVEPLELPLDFLRSEAANHTSGLVHFVLPETLGKQLEQLSQRNGSTLFMYSACGLECSDKPLEWAEGFCGRDINC